MTAGCNAGLVGTPIPIVADVNPGGIEEGPPDCFTFLDGADITARLADVGITQTVPDVTFCLIYYDVPQIALLGFVVPVDVILSLAALLGIWNRVNKV
jgi:hypothetical protein